MSIFGWSLPPGVTTLPGEEPCICEICCQDVDADECICPECPECGSQGDPKCYEEHGLVRTEEQIRLHDETTALWEEENRAENEYWEEYERLRKEGKIEDLI